LTLRHTLATVAYRGGKAIRNAPPGFSTFAAAEGSRTAGEILAHICDLYDWALHMAQGRHLWAPKAPQSWDADRARFFASLAALDAALASPFPGSEEHLFQGPIADSLTHIGQINFLRRLAGSPVKAENYAKAEIVAGRVGEEQTKARSEF
jgi:hypothetical protein